MTAKTVSKVSLGKGRLSASAWIRVAFGKGLAFFFACLSSSLEMSVPM